MLRKIIHYGRLLHWDDGLFLPGLGRFFLSAWCESQGLFGALQPGFNAVEIDSTFYGIPKSSSIVRWRDQSPSDFKICLKVPRSITARTCLVGTQREMDRFIQTIAPLGEKIGVILVRFPPSFDLSKKGVFEEFLKDLPGNHSFAVEFRHPSWYIPQTKDLLEASNICWAASEYPGVRPRSRSDHRFYIHPAGRAAWTF